MNVWVGVLVALLVSLAIGFLNGWLVVKTGLPSFLVTLGTFLILQGVNLAATKLITGNVATDDWSRSPSCTGWSSPPWPPGCCCGPGHELSQVRGVDVEELPEAADLTAPVAAGGDTAS